MKRIEFGNASITLNFEDRTFSVVGATRTLLGKGGSAKFFDDYDREIIVIDKKQQLVSYFIYPKIDNIWSLNAIHSTLSGNYIKRELMRNENIKVTYIDGKGKIHGNHIENAIGERIKGKVIPDWLISVSEH